VWSAISGTGLHASSSLAKSSSLISYSLRIARPRCQL
jgi:hypothetical protein